MISRKQILSFVPGGAPTRLEMLKIFCQQLIDGRDDLNLTVNLIRMYSIEVLEELEE